MPFKVVCSGCGKRLVLPDKYAGRTVKCPACGAAVSAPAAEASEDAQLQLQPVEGTSSEAQGRAPSTGARPAFCPQCGSPVTPGAVICVKCGTNVVTGERLPVAAPSRSRGFRMPVGLFIKIGLVLVGLAVGAWILSKVVKMKNEASVRTTPEQSPAAPAQPQPQPTPPKAAPGAPAAQATPAAPPKPEPPKGPGARERFDAALPKLADPLERENGIKEIRALGEKALPFIRENMKNGDPTVRSGLTRCLTACPATEAVKDLVEIAADGDANVRRTAAKALIELGPGAAGACKEGLKSENAFVREACVRAMAALKGAPPDVFVAVRNLAADPDAGVRLAAVEALGGPLTRSEAVSALVSALNDEDMDVACAASDGLGSQSQTAIPQLVQAIRPQDSRSAFLCWRVMQNSNDEKMRAGIAGKILEMPGRSTPLGGTMGSKLLTVTSTVGTNAMVRRAATSRVNDPGVTPFLALKLAEDMMMRRNAVRALGVTSDSYTYFPLVFVLADGDAVLVDEAMQLLAKQKKSDELLGLLHKAAKGRNLQRSVLARGLLAKFGETEASDALLAALRDASVPGAVRGVTAKVLADLGDKRALETLEVYIDTQGLSPFERLGYLVAAARLGREGGFGEVLGLLRESKDPQARLGAAKALAGVEDAEVGAVLAQITGDATASDELRLECLGSLLRTQGAKAAETLTKQVMTATGRMLAAEVAALGEMGDDAIEPVLKAFNEGNEAAKTKLIPVMSAIGDRKLMNVLLEVLKDDKAPSSLRKSAEAGLAKGLQKNYQGNVMMYERAVNPDKPLDVAKTGLAKSQPNERECASIEMPREILNDPSSWPGRPSMRLSSSYSPGKMYGTSSKMLEETRLRRVIDRTTSKPRKDVELKVPSVSRGLGKGNLMGFIYENKAATPYRTILIAVCVVTEVDNECRIEVELSSDSEDWEWYWPLFQKMFNSVRYEAPLILRSRG